MKQARFRTPLYLVLALVLSASTIGCAASKQLREDNAALKDEIARLGQLVNDYSDELVLVKSLSEEEQMAVRSEMEDMRQGLRKELEFHISKNEALVQKVQDLTVLDIGELSLFRSGQADLTPEGVGIMKRFSNILQRYPGYHVRVEGHTDNVPIGAKLKAQYPSNWELSTSRATSVVRYMIYGLKFPPERLSAVGYAQYRPIRDNATEKGRAQNRRVRMVVFKEQVQ